MQHRRFNQFFWMIVIIFIVYVGTLFYGVFAQANETVPHTKSNCVITQEIILIHDCSQRENGM